MEVAKELDIGGANGLRKQDLVFKIMQAKAESEGNYFAGGILDMANDGYGFLRTQGMRPSISDVYVSQTQIRRFALRAGDYVMGAVRQPKDSEKYFGLLRVDAVNGLDPETAKRRPYRQRRRRRADTRGRDRVGAGEEARRGRAARHGPARRDHPPNARLQPRPATVRPNSFRRHRSRRPPPAEAAVRRRAERRRRG